MDTEFSIASGEFLLRAPVFPNDWTRAFEEDAALPGIWGDALAREAILVSSPSLARSCEKITAGDSVSRKVRDRVEKSLERYGLRMTARSTPFGLMAGVAIGSFGDTPVSKLGQHQAKKVWPDRAWLHTVIADRINEIGMRECGKIRVVVNNTCLVQGDQVVIQALADVHGNRRRTVGMTKAVDLILAAADRPVAVTELVALLAAEFPEMPSAKIWSFLDKLVAIELLLHDRRPPLDDSDPLMYLTRMDGSWNEARRYRELFQVYQSRRLGEGYNSLSTLYSAIGSNEAVHVDMALDADVRLPKHVASEIERAATLLWRVSPAERPFQRALRAYHSEFCERYGRGELVPVARLLSEDTGIGAPAGYRWPASFRVVPEDRWSVPDRDQLLTRMAMAAVASGRRDIDLTDELVTRLSSDSDHPPPSSELYISINASSLRAIEDGDFTVLVSPATGSSQAGATWGRFAHHLDAVDSLKELIQLEESGAEDVLLVQLAFMPHHSHSRNVVAVPRLCENYLAVGMYDDLDMPGHLRLQDIMVSGDSEGFHFFYKPTGREVRFVVPHMLNRAYAPNVARFLWEASRMRSKPLAGWDWGTMESSPILPAVRCGRVVLSPARWRLTAADLAGESDESGLDGWRCQWRVPDRVRLTAADRQLALDLALPAHRRMLREAASKNVCILHEDLSPRPGEGWLRGPDGCHEAELVVPLRAISRGGPRPRRPASPRPRDVAAEYTPGGEWLSAFLYCSWEAQQHVLSHCLSPWVGSLGELVDRWFFIRYTDQASRRSHLRLRIHSESQVSSWRVLSSFHDWSRRLASGGLLSDVELHTYRPELERYGGNSAMTAAEEFFQVDSQLTLFRLAQNADDLDVVADVISLIRLFQGELSQDWTEWVVNQYPKDERLHKTFVHRRRDVVARAEMNNLPEGATEIERRWIGRLINYACSVQMVAAEEAWLDTSDILRSVVHMHCNRALKPMPEAEDKIYAMVRGVAETHLGRRRSKTQP